MEVARGNIDAAIERADAAITHAERSKTPSFVGMAHATAMDCWLAKLYRDRDRDALEQARHHKDEACVILRQIGQGNTAETVARRFGQGSNATVDT